jgi:hypothetical protein
MLTFLNGKKQTAIAWFFFIIFYVDLIGAAYASNRVYNAAPTYTSYSTGNKYSYSNNDYTSQPPQIEARLLSKDNIVKNAVSGKENTKAMPDFLNNITSNVGLNTDALKNAPAKIDSSAAGPGPGQPEMSTFKSVGADNMVNLFTGDFSYNIPLLDVDGYPINIFYNAGPSMDQEASWVGLGWNINPGTINRNMRGLPDDFDGSDKVNKEMSMKPDFTVGVNGSKAKEVVGLPTDPGVVFGINNKSVGIFYNNKRGMGLEIAAKGEFMSHEKVANANKTDKNQKDSVFVPKSLGGPSFGVDLNSQTGLTPSISFSKSLSKKDQVYQAGLSTSIDFNSRSGLGDLTLSGEITKFKDDGKGKRDVLDLNGSSAGLWSSNISFARSSFTPSIRMPITSYNATFVAKLGTARKIKFKGKTITGYYTRSYIAKKHKEVTKDAYGYMYYENANDNKDALLDYNRINDGSYTLKTPVISIPVYTYDVFSITGEGTGGSFRGYRGNMGYVRDPYVRTSSGKFNLQLDLGVRGILHGGTVIGGVYSKSIVGNWDKENELKDKAAFKSSYRNEQRGFYFKNPGEKAIIDEAYYNKMGQDKLMRISMGSRGGNGNNSNVAPFDVSKTTLVNQFQLYNAKRKEAGVIPVNDDAYRIDRDKRTQVISYLTAEEADRVGLDMNIYSYREGVFNPGACEDDNLSKMLISRMPRYEEKYRKPHHISEITVQEGSKRYIYGLPIYQKKQTDVTFSVENLHPNPNPNILPGLITYTGDPKTGVNSKDNKAGKDGLFQKEIIDPFAHAFLLTAILSPDYSDILGDGITDDDLGTAIKFNYTRPLTANKQWGNLGWRLPATKEANTANYNRGLVTDDQDDKASYSFGTKELWYTHSIESKNMVATFTLSNRLDGWGVNGENGGRLDDIMDVNAPCQKKLDRIDLYVKADLINAKKNGTTAKPIKTVHFKYSYELCRNYAMNSGTAIDEDNKWPSAKPNINTNQGKLTLKSIYFTYNNNNHQKNRYRFKYADQTSTDKDYNPTQYDRWGTYKNNNNNLGTGTTNEDYPYTNHSKSLSDNFAAAWSLNQILLPSGAKIEVNYEADDYAYVQNKRAAEMTPILGFGQSATDYNPNSVLKNKLYNGLAFLWNFTNDKKFVFFDAPVAVSSKEDIGRLYLQDLKQLLFKLWIKMPSGTFYGTSGFEPMFIYCNIDDYGVVAGSNGTKFYVKIGEASRNTDSHGSQIMETNYQYLRDQLPGKAYPGSDIGNSTAVGQIVKSLYAMVNNIRTGVTGFENNARADGWGKEVDLDRSGVRLSNPFFKKLGGGHRVKSVRILDNWKKMGSSNPNDPNAPDINSYYGQEYDYTTTELVNGLPVNISSGVASYEPGVGNEENPWREILQYNRSNPLGPTELGNIELPVAETFFPSPSVGYSRVTVKSIHSKNKTNPAENINIKSGVGMQETQFYTTKDFPTFSEHTDMSPASRHHFKPSAINKIFNFGKKDYISITQGFRVVLNDMNGKTKLQASYAENDLNNAINKTTYYYRINKYGENKFKFNNVLPTVAGTDGKIVNKLVGRDIEVMNDFRDHFTTTRSAQVPLNLEFFTAAGWPVLIPTVFKAIFRDESLFRSATTLKVVNEYGILDSVSNFDKGSLVGTKNLVFNAETGDVMVSRTQNEFNKPIYNFSYPAYWAVDDMGPAYKNIDASFNHLTFRHGKIDAGLTREEINNYFASGDEIYVVDNFTGIFKEHPACDAGATCGNFTILPKSSEFRIWALDITKDPRNPTKEFIFIDRNGTPYNAGDANIRIIRSGRRNMMDASVGSITSMANPILFDLNNNYDKIAITNTTDVVNTGAMEYKEKWKVEDAFWVEEKETVVTRYSEVGPVKIYSPIHSYSLRNEDWRGARTGSDQAFLNDPKSFVARRNSTKKYRVSSLDDYEQQSWILFDFHDIVGFKVKSAFLSMACHTDFPNEPHPHYTPNLDLSGREIYHESTNPHGNIRPFEINGPSNNDFIISRMKINQWPAHTSTIWNDQFYTSIPSNSEDRTYVTGPWSANGGVGLPILDYTGVPNNLNLGGKIEIGTMLNAMLRDKADLTKNYITGFNIRIPVNPPRNRYPERERETRVCFNNAFDLGIPGDRLKPSIALKCYSCASPLPVNSPLDNDKEYGECKFTTTEYICHSVFDKDYINPYVRGLLGNWRPLKSYVYYGERREQDPVAISGTNIAKDGIIKDFEPFWNFAATNTALITKTNSVKWTWNSEITQYNRKGAELENKDPLQRYNASIYGYNEALPIAVVNNSKLRQSAFEGFEDYFFEDQTCKMNCNPNKRHFDTKINIQQLATDQTHSGKYSLKIDNNTSNTTITSIKIKMSPDNTSVDPNTPDLRIGYISTSTNTPNINLNGIGLLGNYQSSNNFQHTRIDESINFYYNRDGQDGLPCSGPDYCWDHEGQNSINWTGVLQIIEPGNYNFKCMSPDDFTSIVIDGSTTVFQVRGYDQDCPPSSTGLDGNQIFLSTGNHIVNIYFCDAYSGRRNAGNVNFLWKKPCSNDFTLVPKINMYPNQALANLAISGTSSYVCTNVSTIKPLSNFLIDEFNLIQSTDATQTTPAIQRKMVASVWVKKGIIDCRCENYDGFTMSIKNGSGMSATTIATLAHKGPIIEGWQLFEAEFVVPSTGTELEFYINNTGNNAPVYIDDLRFHPYNSNMKSFVYNPLNLKPAAELDENNYATFYEYDDDGTLIRVKKETKLGIKTIQETRSSLQKAVTDF